MGGGQEDPGSGGSFPLIHLGVRGGYLYGYKSILEPSSSTGGEDTMSGDGDLSETLHELGLGGILVSEELRERQACCGGVARELWGPPPPHHGETFQGTVEPPGSRLRPHPLH